MKKSISFYEFERAFAEIRPDNFTRAGLKALFDYLENFEAETGEEIEFDVIALCCDFVEYENIAEFNSDYGADYESRDEIGETFVIDVDDEAFIIQAF
jgi:hypothetical protein